MNSTNPSRSTSVTVETPAPIRLRDKLMLYLFVGLFILFSSILLVELVFSLLG